MCGPVAPAPSPTLLATILANRLVEVVGWLGGLGLWCSFLFLVSVTVSTHLLVSYASPYDVSDMFFSLFFSIWCAVEFSPRGEELVFFGLV